MCSSVQFITFLWSSLSEMFSKADLKKHLLKVARMAGFGSLERWHRKTFCRLQLARLRISRKTGLGKDSRFRSAILPEKERNKKFLHLFSSDVGRTFFSSSSHLYDFFRLPVFRFQWYINKSLGFRSRKKSIFCLLRKQAKNEKKTKPTRPGEMGQKFSSSSTWASSEGHGSSEGSLRPCHSTRMVLIQASRNLGQGWFTGFETPVLRGFFSELLPLWSHFSSIMANSSSLSRRVS